MDGETPRPMTLISGQQATTVVCNLLTATTPRLTPTGKISHAKTRVYTQRYRKEWEQMQDFKGWLTSVPHQPTRAYCIYCKKNLHAHRLSLLKHTCTMKHQRAALTHKMEEKKSSRKWDANALEVGLIEEVEAVDDPRTEGDEENEEDIEYIVERLDTDEEEATDMQEVKEETEEIIDDEEEREKEIVSDLYTQLQSDDEDMKPVIKKVKLSNQKCRDTLAEAMAHVHSEYLEEEVEDQNVQIEMVVESANPDVSILSDAVDDTKETLKEMLENENTEIKVDKKSIGKVPENNKPDLIVTPSLPVLDTTYQTNIISSTPTQNTINFLPIAPNLKNNKTITLMCGNKTFTLTGGTFQPGTQYVLTKLKGKPLMMADSKKTIAVSDPDKIKISSLPTSVTSQSSPVTPSTSQQPIVSTNQQSNAASIKGQSLSKKVYLGKQPIKSTTTRKLRISTYVIDNTKGIPIGGLQVSLYKLMDGKWTFLNESNTNAEGYCVDLVEKVNCTIGRYKIHFDVDKYFTLRRIETMFPFVEIVFDVKNPNGHYHMPLLLSPFSYSTYRGT